LTPSLSSLLCADGDNILIGEPMDELMGEQALPPPDPPPIEATAVWRRFAPPNPSPVEPTTVWHLQQQFGIRLEVSPMLRRPPSTSANSPQWNSKIQLFDLFRTMELEKQTLQTNQLFDSNAGAFWDTLETRAYCRACEKVVRRLNACKGDHIAAQQEILLVSLRLVHLISHEWVQKLGWCDEVTFSMLRLGLVHECHDFVVWWSTQQEEQRTKYVFGERLLNFKSPAAPQLSFTKNTPLEQIVT
jgi:hypothetical protein